MKPSTDPLILEMVEDSLTANVLLSEEERASLTVQLLKAKDKLVSLNKEIEELRDVLNDRMKKLNALTSAKIPSLMDKLGEESIPIGPNASLTIVRLLHCGITKDNEEEAYGWLEDHGHASVISDIITLKFDKGLKDEADKAAEELKRSNLEFERTQKVHPSTLKALIRREIQGGSDIPFETFNIYTPDVAEIQFNKK